MDKNVKVFALLGFAGIGRTSLVNRFATNFFTENTRYSTENEISAVFQFKGAATSDVHQIQLVAPIVKTDTDITLTEWFDRVEGVFLCFDVTDVESFTDIENTFWYETLRKDTTLPAVVLGTHADETSRQVSAMVAKRWSRERFLPYFEVSAQTGKNLHQSMDAMCVLHRRAKEGFPLRTRLRSLSESESSSAAQTPRVVRKQTERSEKSEKVSSQTSEMTQSEQSELSEDV